MKTSSEITYTTAKAQDQPPTPQDMTMLSVALLNGYPLSL